MLITNRMSCVRAAAVQGESWTPMSRGPFDMQAMGSTCLSTTSGVLMVAGRFPAITIQASWDGGFSFSFFTVDTSSMWANGAMAEIAPDVVLFVYGGPSAPNELRSQRFKVEHDPPRLRPLAADEPPF
jgi:hypothetical protein